MCQELKESLDDGKRLAEELVRHLCEMGASEAILTVLLEDEKYEVRVAHCPVAPIEPS